MLYGTEPKAMNKGVLMQSRSILTTLTFISLIFACGGCESGPTARDAWSKGLRACAEDDVLKHADTLLYLGPSGAYGPGSKWRMRDDGSYEPRWPFAAAVPNESERMKFIVRGKEADCSVDRSASWSISPQLLFSSDLLPISADVKADLSAAQKAVVRAVKWRTDRLNELEYEEWAKSSHSGKYAKDTLRDPIHSRIENAAVLVHGFSAELTYSGKQAMELSAKFPLNQEVDLGGGLSAKRTSQTTLSIHSSDDFYVVCTLLPFDLDGFHMTATGPEGRLLKSEPVTISKIAKVTPPPEKPLEID